MGWQEHMAAVRVSAGEIEVLTYRIENGGSDWTAGGAKAHTTTMTSPTETAAIMEMTVVPRLIEQREHHERIVGEALRAIQAVRERLGQPEADILEMFYIDGFMSWEIANELNTTVDGVFYRKRKALAWMDENMEMVG